MALSLCCAACSRPPAAPVQQAADGSGADLPMPELSGADRDKLLALVKPGFAPLWFELSAEGPVQIPAPEEASLAPWTPWPAARFIADVVIDGERLVMPVNREGFLVWVPPEPAAVNAASGARLYRVDLTGPWDPFTIGGVFPYSGLSAPPETGQSASGPPAAGLAVLLYRDVVFRGEDGGPPPAPVWALPAGSLDAAPLTVPAFAGLDNAPFRGEGWDIKTLRPGRNGFWYFRAERGGAEPESAWFQAADLSGTAETVRFGVFRSGVRPYTISDAPPSLRAALEAAVQRAQTGEIPLVRLLVAEGPVSGARYYSPAGDTSPEGDDGNMVELSGFYRASGSGGGDLEAALAYPDGRGVYSENGGVTGFSLPALPEGFVYTRLGPAGGRTVIAAWEEQQDWSVAAAGFLVITLPVW